MVKTPGFPCRGFRVQSLVGEMRSHMPGSQKNKTENIVTNSIENIKMSTSKKKLKRQLLCIFLDHMELDPLEIDVPSPEQLINRKARRNLNWTVSKK